MEISVSYGYDNDFMKATRYSEMATATVVNFFEFYKKVVIFIIKLTPYRLKVLHSDYV